MIKVESEAACFTLFFKDTPILKVSTGESLVNTPNKASEASNSSPGQDAAAERTCSGPSFQLIE